MGVKEFSTQYQILTEPLSAIDIVNVNKWYPKTSVPLFDRKRQQYTYPSFFTDDRSLTAVETPQVDKWVGYHPDYIWDRKKWQFTYPFFFYDTDLEKAIHMGYLPTFPDFVWDRKRQQVTYSTHFPRALPIDNAVGMGGGVLLYYRRLFQYPTWAAIDPRQLTLAERIDVDKWYVEHLRQAVRLKATPHLYPYFSFHTVPFENAVALASKRNRTDFTEATKNTTDFSTPAKNTTDFTPVVKNTTDMTDP